MVTKPLLTPPLNVRSTAAALGVSVSTVNRLLREGELGFVRTSRGRIGVPLSEVRRYLDANFVPARSAS